MRHIFEEAERATAILRQLLWNAHETRMEMRTVAINQVVLQAIEVQQASLAQERIRLEMDLDTSWPLVHGDAGQLQQVLMMEQFFLSPCAQPAAYPELPTC